MRSTTWTLDGALELVRIIQPQVRKFNYHLCLGGGVLNKGASDKDLDLYFLPMASRTMVPNTTGLESFLNDIWGRSGVIGNGGRLQLQVEEPNSEYGPVDPNSGELAYKLKLKFTYSGSYRIDVFVL